MSSNLLTNIFSQGNWIVINMPMARIIGINATVLLMRYVQLKEKYNGTFYQTRPELEKYTNLSEKVQRATDKKLMEIGLISYERKGIPPVNHYKLHDEAILDLLEEENQFRQKEGINSPLPTQFRQKGGIESDLSCNQEKEEKKNKESFLKEKTKGFSNPPKKILKRRTNKTNKPSEPCTTKKIKAVSCSKNEYLVLQTWNKNRSKGKIRLKEHPEHSCSHPKLIHSKTLYKTIQAIRSFDKGLLYQKSGVVYPEQFTAKDKKEINKYSGTGNLVTFIEEWQDLFVNPEYFPSEYQQKINLYEFLVGNPNNGAPSALLNYCLLDNMKRAKPELIDTNPSDSEDIADRWNYIIGKYKPGHNEEFIKISNYVNHLYDNSCEFEIGMSAYSDTVTAIVKIISDNAEWMKKENVTPEVMNGKWFKEQLSEITTIPSGGFTPRPAKKRVKREKRPEKR